MTTIEMIERIQDLYTPDCGVYHMLGDLKTRVESERAALKAAVDEIAKRERGRHTCTFRQGQPCAGCEIINALDIIAEKTGVRHVDN